MSTSDDPAPLEDVRRGAGSGSVGDDFDESLDFNFVSCDGVVDSCKLRRCRFPTASVAAGVGGLPRLPVNLGLNSGLGSCFLTGLAGAEADLVAGSWICLGDSDSGVEAAEFFRSRLKVFLETNLCDTLFSKLLHLQWQKLPSSQSKPYHIGIRHRPVVKDENLLGNRPSWDLAKSATFFLIKIIFPGKIVGSPSANYIIKIIDYCNLNFGLRNFPAKDIT